MAETALQLYTGNEQERLTLLKDYRPHDHLASWKANDRGMNRTVDYYPAAWRLYELSLRYPFANFSSEIVHKDPEKNFVVVRARLYLGPSYEDSPKKAEAHKQGPLSELDKVETKAKARAARDFGIGTEHALDMDEAEADAVPGEPTPADPNGKTRKVVEADRAAAGNGRDPVVTDIEKHLEAYRVLNAVNTAWCAKTSNWQMRVIRKALDIADSEPYPTAFTADDALRIGLYVAAKKQEAGKATPGGKEG